jgi:hypothetical protein
VREKWLLAKPVSCLTRDFGILLTTIARPLEDEDASVYVTHHLVLQSLELSSLTPSHA